MQKSSGRPYEKHSLTLIPEKDGHVSTSLGQPETMEKQSTLDKARPSIAIVAQPRFRSLQFRRVFGIRRCFNNRQAAGPPYTSTFLVSFYRRA